LVAGVACLAIGLWLFSRSHADLRTNWSVTLELRQEHRLVSHGVVSHDPPSGHFAWALRRKGIPERELDRKCALVHRDGRFGTAVGTIQAPAPSSSDERFAQARADAAIVITSTPAKTVVNRESHDIGPPIRHQSIWRITVRKGRGMARLVFGMNQSLDGYIDHMAFAPGPALFRHFIEEAQRQKGSVYGRKMYEVMRYWDDDHPEWGAAEHAFAAAWRKQPKWVVSRSLKSVGPNARLVADDLEGAIRELKAQRDGEIEVAGPRLAHSLTALGLIDEYRIYLHPVVLGHGQPYFAGARPLLRLMAHDRIGEDVIRLAYVPA
jgi:dihydrofolate reductase